MSLIWLVRRLLLRLVAICLGGLVGVVVSAGLGWPVAGALLGAATAVSIVVIRDALRATRLLNWLRGEQRDDAPRDAGLWGELAYRIERALRQREQALQTERQRLSDFLSGIEASPNGVLLLDEDSRISWCNPVAAVQLGLDPQRDVGQHLTNLVRAPAFVSYMQDRNWHEPTTFSRLGGEGTLQVLLRAYGQGQTLLVSQDITERLQSDAMRRDFVANVSHEIRTPLTVLAGFVETMRSLPLTEVERQRVMALMQQQTDRMQVLVSDLLTLAQLEGSPRPPSDRWVSVAQLVQRVHADLVTLSRGRHAISVTAGPMVELAGADAELFSAVLNLGTNAVRYTPDGGTIQLCWQVRGDGGLVVEVADDGPGIEREHIPRLTERFYRVDGSRSRETGGTGLGLAIVKHVVQRHGGELDIDSAPGRGSRFRLLLPAVRVRKLPVSNPVQLPA